MYHLDSDTCIEILRGRLPLGQRLMRQMPPDSFGVSTVVQGELLYGAQRSSNPEEGRRCVESLLHPLTLVPFDARCAVEYAKVRNGLRSRGCMIGPNDLLIAATALAHGAVLVTNNVREFGRVPGLAVESWDEVDF